jgi:hypothetical protein
VAAPVNQRRPVTAGRPALKMMSGVDNLVSPTQKFFWTLIISTFDFLSDCYLIVPFMTQTADFPCKFTTSYITQVTPMEYDEFYEQLTLQEFRDLPGCFFEYACLNNVDCGGVAPVEDPRCTCNTQGLDDNDAMQDEIDVLWFFAIVYFIGLLVKELTKTTMIFLFFCKPSMQATKSLKYAVNTPMMLLLSWVPNLRKSGVKAHQAVLEKAEPAYNILIDVVLEDLPGLVIPLWYDAL